MINRQQTIKDYNRKDNGRKIDEQLILTKSPLLQIKIIGEKF